MMCADNKGRGRKDACTGDSGGPLTWLDLKSEQLKLIGVVSFGDSCAKAAYPGVYGDMVVVLDWVKGIIGTSNEDTCRMGKCMTKDKLDYEVRRYFYDSKNHYYQ